jgi:hypothetical protein
VKLDKNEDCLEDGERIPLRLVFAGGDQASSPNES